MLNLQTPKNLIQFYLSIPISIIIQQYKMYPSITMIQICLDLAQMIIQSLSLIREHIPSQITTKNSRAPESEAPKSVPHQTSFRTYPLLLLPCNISSFRGIAWRQQQMLSFNTLWSGRLFVADFSGPRAVFGAVYNGAAVFCAVLCGAERLSGGSQGRRSPPSYSVA